MEMNGRRRRGSGAALYVTMAGAFLVIAAVTAMGLFFKISKITVNGAGRYTAQEIIAASGVEPDNSIFFVSMSRAEVRIKSALPYIDSVKVTRVLPGTVIIDVTEAKRAASFTYGGSTWVTDVKGRILEETDAAGAAGTVELRGVTPEKPEVGKSLSLGQAETVRLRCLLNTLSILDASGRLALTEWLDLSNLAAVTFYCNGYRINLNKADDMTDLEAKFDILEDFFADHPDAGYGQNVWYEEDGRLHFKP